MKEIEPLSRLIMLEWHLDLLTYLIEAQLWFIVMSFLSYERVWWPSRLSWWIGDNFSTDNHVVSPWTCWIWAVITIPLLVIPFFGVDWIHLKPHLSAVLISRDAVFVCWWFLNHWACLLPIAFIEVMLKFMEHLSEDLIHRRDRE